MQTVLCEGRDVEDNDIAGRETWTPRDQTNFFEKFKGLHMGEDVKGRT